MKVILGATLGLFLIVACQIVQQTGRSQFIIVSESQELQLGDDAYRRHSKKSRPSTRSDWQAQLHRVGQRIAAVSGQARVQVGISM